MLPHPSTRPSGAVRRCGPFDAARPRERDARVADRALRESRSKTYSSVMHRCGSQRTLDPETGTEALSMDGKAQLEWKDDSGTSTMVSAWATTRTSRGAGSDTTAPYAVKKLPDVRPRERTYRLPPDRGAFTLSGSSVDRVVAGVEYQRQSKLRGGWDRLTAKRALRSLQRQFPPPAPPRPRGPAAAPSRHTVAPARPNPDKYTERDVQALMARTPGSVNEYIRRGAPSMSSRQAPISPWATSVRRWRSTEVRPGACPARLCVPLAGQAGRGRP